MGAFKDFLDSIKATLFGLVPYGGTLIPTSETFPILIAQHVKGGFYALASLDQLADIPLANLQLGQEVVIGTARYRLIVMPPQTISEIPGYDLEDYWELFESGGTPPPGPQGDKGWSPYYSYEDDGALRVVARLIDYTGGAGTKPSIPINNYVGPSGLTTKSLATNLKGPKGDTGNVANFRPEAFFFNGTKKTGPPGTTWVDSEGFFIYVSDSNFQITNTHSSTRRFRVEGEVPVSNDSGSDSWVVLLLQKSTSGWAVDQAGIKNETRLDMNFSQEDFVNDASFPGARKIHVWATIQLAAGASTYLRLALTQTAGSSSKYSLGYLEVFGL